MKCKKCGNELKPDAAFCQSCGAPVEAEDQKKDAPAAEASAKEETPAADGKAEDSKAADTKAADTKAEDNKSAAEAKAETPADNAQAQAPVNNAQPQAAAAPKKNSKILPIIIGAAALVVVVILAIVGIKMIGGSKKSGTSKVVAYVSHDTLCVILDTTAKNPKILEVCDIDIDEDYFSYYPTSMVTWSEDEKTLYFFNDLEDDGCATLCKVTVSKLGNDKSKNEGKIVEIADHVRINSLRILNGGKLAYLTNKDKLMVYSGKDPVEIEKDVANAYVTEDGKGLVILFDEDENGFYSLGYVDSKLNMTELDDDVSNISNIDEKEVYYYQVDDETWDTTLMVASYDGNTNEITDHLGNISTITDNGFYYTEESDDTLTLYDYINDPYASSDENLTEPVYPESDQAFVQVNSSEVFDKDKVSYINKYYHGDFIEYIEEYCWTYTYSGVDYYRIYNYDTSKEYYYDPAKDKYYFYDPDLYQSIMDEYYEAWDNYYLVSDRRYLRQSLMDYEVTTGSVSLYYYHNGESELLAEDCTNVNFVYFTEKNPIAIYSLLDTDDIEKIDIDNVSYAYEAYDMLFGSNTAQNSAIYYAIGNSAGNSLELEGTVTDSMYSEDDGLLGLTVYVINKKDETEKQIFLYSVKGTTLTLQEKFDDEAECISAFKKGCTFFIKDVNSEGSEGDLYFFDGKNNTRVIKNVSLWNAAYLYDTGSILCYDEDDLVLYNKNGEEIVKLGEVSYIFMYVNYISDKSITFYEDGKIRYYNGKEITKIVNGVDQAWFNISSENCTYLYTRR